MSTVTVSEKGQVVIPAEIRKLLGIAPGTQLDFTIEGQSLRVEVSRRAAPTRLEDGYGLLVCRKPGKRRLSEFDVAEAMRKQTK
ncbi:AbrB/MazE/SpoVT family DNA-binding domain-containing protein [Burkholderiaceae bacterium FT117]|uniref:AbrB/MazE/SpoVT family DNA-binding domain-containing protein n=1 Tax=Zeimonas sediminis TaxID=2944268 RepID=UPI0023430287|nr:AbrB/MazE/SpoVT family DNA-binding domain-containing protein [Zeimonas sediminis]MCM5571608.1 AbrB/MazE/SpoVT family DNA-binding domain-containing protein [Zeimonas sediminis]